MKNILIIAGAFILMSASCKKTTGSLYNSNVKAPITLEFDNIVGGADLQLNTGSYTNESGEQFKVSMLRYFVSNIVLTNVNGSKYIVPQDSSYFLIDESKPSTLKTSIKIPEGEYSKLEFILGVDSLRNTKDLSQRTGVLDPTGEASGMYWSWNSGYIFFKMEGNSPSSKLTNNVFQYHIGLFGGYSTPTLNNLKNISIDLTQRGIAKVKTGKTPNVHLLVDVSKVFNGTNKVSISANTVVMASAFSAKIADNFTSMFQHDHTEN
ncbi:MAG: MbnP family protein [Sediminibacterium sp.]